MDAVISSWWFQAIGWVGSALVVFSLTQAEKSLLRFRWLNLAGAVIATIWNFIAGAWPFVAMNGAITIIDAIYIARLRKQRHDQQAYIVVEVAPNSAYLGNLLADNKADIAQYANFDVVGQSGPNSNRSAFLVLSGNETIGVLEVEDSGNGVGTVILDWVNPKYRNFTPGEFVFQQSGIFNAKGFNKLVVPTQLSTNENTREYLTRVGFTNTENGWERSV